MPDDSIDFSLVPIEDDPFVAAAPPSGNVMDPASQYHSSWADSPLAKVGRLIGERGLAGAMPPRTIGASADTLPGFWQRWPEMISKLTGRKADAAPVAGAPADNFAAAKDQLDLTPQEQALYQRHQTNLTGPGGVDNPNGSRSTLYQAVVEHDGMFYNVPTVWDGKIHPIDEAARRVADEGWDKFPSYATPDAADARYAQMHGFMEKDTKSYLQMKAAADKAGVKLVPVDHDPFAPKKMSTLGRTGDMAVPPQEGQQPVYPAPPVRDPNDPMVNVDRSLPLPPDRNSFMPQDVMDYRGSLPPQRDI